MARLLLRYVHSFRDRHGKPRHYFRRGHQRCVLPGPPGSTEFMEAYAAALAAQRPPVGPRKPVVPRSIRALVLKYYDSPHYLSLKTVSRGNYRRILDGFCKEHGDRSVSGLSRERLTAIVGRMADRPGAAIVLLKRLKTVIRLALDLGWITVDPTHRLRSYRSTEMHCWTEEEIAQFEESWPVGTKRRLAFALHLYTGQRRSDVHRMTWGDYDGNTIRVVQQKTGTKLAVAVHPALKAILDETPREAVAILITFFGRPFTVAGYGQWMSGAIRVAGLPERCVLHGLRKAAARRLAEAGCSVHEIAAITGHKSLAEVERYTRDADQERLAKAAVLKLGRRDNGK